MTDPEDRSNWNPPPATYAEPTKPGAMGRMLARVKSELADVEEKLQMTDPKRSEMLPSLREHVDQIAAALLETESKCAKELLAKGLRVEDLFRTYFEGDHYLLHMPSRVGYKITMRCDADSATWVAEPMSEIEFVVAPKD
jgi:glutamine synthetase adenylyltransferase